jgi:ribosomal protein L40E
MQCAKCGREIGPQATECPYCASKGEVRVLSREERENFDGVTLGDESSAGGDYTYESQGARNRVYVRQVNFGSGGTSIWTKLAIVAVIGLLLFVVLPMFFLFFAAAAVVWFIISLLRR